MNIKFTLITISYNQDKFLEECILSVINQRYEDLQYIVIDGGSNDSSVKIIKKYDDKIDYWVSEKDSGAANALNKGLEQVNGDFVGFINSDDYLTEGALKQLDFQIRTHPGFDVYYGPGFIKDEINNTYKKIIPSKWELGCYRSGISVMFQQSVFIKSDYFASGLRFNESNTTHWDGELLVDLSLHGARFYRHNVPIGVFRIHGASITGNSLQGASMSKYQEQQQILFSKIDKAKILFNTTKWYWLSWLLIHDFKNTLNRVVSKLF